MLGGGQGDLILAEESPSAWWCLVPSGDKASTPRMGAVLHLSAALMSQVGGAQVLADARAVLQAISDQQIACAALASSQTVASECSAFSPNAFVSIDGQGSRQVTMVGTSYRKSGDARWSDVVISGDTNTAQDRSTVSMLFADPSYTQAALEYCQSPKGKAYCSSPSSTLRYAETVNDFKYGNALEKYLFPSQGN